jgi:hypothetical protein
MAIWEPLPAREILDALASHPRVKRVVVELHATPGTLRKTFRALASCSSVEILQICTDSFEDAAESFAHLMEATTSIREVHLDSQHHFHSTEISNAFLHGLSFHRSLKGVLIQNNAVDAAALAKVFEASPTIQRLSLICGKVTGLESAIPTLRRTRRLQRVHLHNLWLEKDGASLLLGALSRHPVRHLDISGIAVTSDLCCSLASLVREVRTLRALCAPDVPCGPDLKDAVLSHPCLRTIILNPEDFGDEAADVVAACRGREAAAAAEKPAKKVRWRGVYV